MKAKPLGVLLILSTLLLSIAFPSFAANAQTSENTNQTALPTGQAASTSPSDKAEVISHAATNCDIQALKSAIGVSDDDQNYNQIVDGHGTGLRAPTAAEWQTLSGSLQIADRITYQSSPSAVDNSALPWFPPIGNQGTEGSCAAWSIGYYVKTFQEAKEHGWDLSGAEWLGGFYGAPNDSYQNELMSPDFIYHLTNGGIDEGISFEDAVNLIHYIGVSSWQTMPYTMTDYTSWPTEEAWTEAALYRGNSSAQYLSLTTASGLDSLKDWLASGNLASIAVDASQYHDLTSNDVWTVDNYANPTLNHANTIVGYDDDFSYIEGNQTRYGAFKIANSWGIGGVGGVYKWENVPDGFIWISYEAMEEVVKSCIFFTDSIGYQPELSATFKIDHDIRSDCQITVGMGSPSPVAQKSFSQYVDGGSHPFGSSNIVMDITEFKNSVPSLNNQNYFLKVRDTGSGSVGNITKFAIGNCSSLDVPKATIQNSNVYVNVTYNVVNPQLTVSPTTGPGGGAMAINGSGFTSDYTVNLYYLNPINSTWTSIVNNTATTNSGNFTYNLNAPDLLQSLPAGDNSPISDDIVFRAVDNTSGIPCNATTPYSEWRQGLLSVDGATATGLFGNNTDLSSTVKVRVGKSLTVSGLWFRPGGIAVSWDSATNLGSIVANATGFFSAAVTIPASDTGAHNLTLTNGNTDFVVTVTYLPYTLNDYDGLWHTADFNVNLTPDPANAETYYRINGGTILSVNVDGQPRITTDGSSNTLEYWSVDGVGNAETPHKMLTNIKLDKTAPSGSIQINDGANYTTSTSVTLTLTASDVTSGVYQVRFSNDGVWDTEHWISFSSSRSWTLSSGDGEKTVYYQIRDNAGLISSFNDSITLDTTNPSVNVGQQVLTSPGTMVTFDASGSTDDTGIIDYLWNFGDGTSGTGVTTTHSYENSGNYTATLVVEDAAGNTATNHIAVTVQTQTLATIPEFPSILGISILMLAMLLSVLWLKKAKNSRPKPHPSCLHA